MSLSPGLRVGALRQIISFAILQKMHHQKPEGDESQDVRNALKVVAVILARYEVRKLKRLYDEFDHDLVLPLLLGEVALHNFGSLELQDIPTNIDLEAAKSFAHDTLKPCNAYSIALGTGLPRETVRRKIHRLVELGWISRRANGHLFISEAALTHFGHLFSSRELPELLETANRVRKRLDLSDESARTAVGEGCA